jgi:hypothetical protein
MLVRARRASPAQSRHALTLPSLSSPARAAHWQDAHFAATYYEFAETLSFGIVRAASDNIPSLKEYLGASDSTFLFYKVSALLCPCAYAARLWYEHCRSVCAPDPPALLPAARPGGESGGQDCRAQDVRDQG